MDVNQTRFHLVYGKQDWYPAAIGSPPDESQFDWNADDATLSLHQELFIFPGRTGQVPLDVTSRRGAGRDRYGNWYWIDATGRELRFLGMSKTTAEHFWRSGDEVRQCPPVGEFFSKSGPPATVEQEFSGLAVTTDHYLIIGVLEPKGLLVFDLHSGGPPTHLLWPNNVPFAPFDIAPATDGGAWVLDRVNKAYWKLDRSFSVQGYQASPPVAEAGVFQPVNNAMKPVTGSGPSACATSQVSQDFAVSLAGLSDPIAIEALADGSVVILDNPPGSYYSVVHRFQDGAEAGAPIALDRALEAYVPDVPNPIVPHPDAVRGYDVAFIAGASQSETSGVLYIAEIEGNQTFAFDLAVQKTNFSLEVKALYFPMRQFGGKALVAAGSGVYYDFQEQWVPLVQQPRPTYQSRAQLLLPQPDESAGPDPQPAAFDGKQQSCVWHRLFLEACIPPGAAVVVESRAADLKQLLPAVPWQTEPSLYLRGDGAELPFYQSQLQDQADRAGTWELLFQNARGRYLQLRLTIRGTGRNTPRLHALRIYYPRFSYLRQYLPAVYRDDAVSASFLDRFLANVEGFYTVLEGKIERVQALFDSRIAPAEYLDWLASWMSIVLDTNWSERTKRLVLSHAPQMFRERGTPNGIVRAIRLMLDPCPDDSLFDESICSNGDCTPSSSVFSVRLVERFLTRSAPGVAYGDPTDVEGPNSVLPTSAWTPAQGDEVLHQRFRCYLQTQYGAIASLNQAWATNYSTFEDPGLVLPAIQPSQAVRAQDWRRFLRDGLGFTYAPVTSSDLGAYQAFLARRYKSIGDLNTAYSLTGANRFTGFDFVSLPASMPHGGPALQDWIAFVSVALPVQQNAHRFTVLVPVSLNDSPDTQQTRLSVAQRVAEIEKPAHTSFDVRLYWGMFRAGEARLGRDTLLGPGSRFAAIVLGAGYLAGGNLAFGQPDVTDRKRIEGLPLAQKCCDPKPQERCI